MATKKSKKTRHAAPAKKPRPAGQRKEVIVIHDESPHQQQQVNDDQRDHRSEEGADENRADHDKLNDPRADQNDKANDPRADHNDKANDPRAQNDKANDELRAQTRARRHEEAVAEAPLTTELLAGARVAAQVAGVVGSREAPRFTPRLAAALGGDPFATGASLAEQSAARQALLRLSDAERDLVAGFRDGRLGVISQPLATVIYDLLVPVAAAILAAESARFGVPLAAPAIEAVARDPAAFARHRELAAAVRALGTTPSSEAVLPTPPSGRPPHRPRQPKGCYRCGKQGHTVKACPLLATGGAK